MNTLAVAGLKAGRKILESLGLVPDKEVWNGFITHLAEGGTLEAAVDLDFTCGRSPSLMLTTYRGKQKEVTIYDIVPPGSAEDQRQWGVDVVAALGFPPGSEVYAIHVVCDTRQVASIKVTQNLQRHTQNTLLRCLKDCKAVLRSAPTEQTGESASR